MSTWKNGATAQRFLAGPRTSAASGWERPSTRQRIAAPSSSSEAAHLSRKLSLDATAAVGLNLRTGAIIDWYLGGFTLAY